MKRIFQSILILLIAAFMSMPVCVSAEEIDMDERPQVTNIAPDKEWMVKFNMSLEKQTVNSDNIKVYKGDYPDNNVPVAVSIRPGSDASEVIIGTPASGYVPGRTYSLVIGKNVKTDSNLTLAKPVKMMFKVDSSFNNGSSYSDGAQITSLSFGYTPLAQGQKQDFYLKANGGKVQYRIFVHEYAYGYDDYTELTNGYTNAVDGSTPYKVTALKDLESSVNGQKYKVIVFVKNAGSTGTHKTDIADVKDMDYDNYYVDYFKVVPAKISIEGSKSTAYSLEQEVNKQMTLGPQTNEGDDTPSWVNSNSNMVKYYLNPDNFMDDYGKYLFLRLDSYVDDISADSINNLLKGAGALEGKGQAFLDAAKQYNINPAYFVSHALIETASGTSALSKGVTVQGKKVYNFFGVRAVDNNVVSGGSDYAFTKGWFTPEAAIMGGAEYIATKYIKNPSTNQNTLYKMRWNPDSPGTNQYATDIAWGVKILSNINTLMKTSKAAVKYEVPAFLK